MAISILVITRDFDLTLLLISLGILLLLILILLNLIRLLSIVFGGNLVLGWLFIGSLIGVIFNSLKLQCRLDLVVKRGSLLLQIPNVLHEFRADHCTSELFDVDDTFPIGVDFCKLGQQILDEIITIFDFTCFDSFFGHVIDKGLANISSISGIEVLRKTIPNTGDL